MKRFPNLEKQWMQEKYNELQKKRFSYLEKIYATNRAKYWEIRV